MKIRKAFFLAITIFYSLNIWAQNVLPSDFDRRHFIETQAFVILTPILNPSPEFYQLNYGYRLTPKDELSFEVITWAYQGPLGRPLGPDHDAPESNYRGDVKSLGAGLSYKRFLWKGVYTRLHTTAFRQTYRDEEKKKIQSGFMLFNTLRFGYHFKIFKNRFFISPNLGATYWPILTNLPDDFKVEEKKWDNYFLGEIGLHVGINF